MTATQQRQVFLLPDLGEGLTEAELVNWLVGVGDKIVVDQPIAEVETAKSVVEVPSPFAGTVAVLHGDAGSTIDVGKPLISVDAIEVADSADVVAAGPGDVPAAGDGSPAGEAYRTEERAGIQAPEEPVDAAAGGRAAGSGEAAGRGDAEGSGETTENGEAAGSGNVLIGYGTPGGQSGSKRTRRRKGSAADAAPAAAASETQDAATQAGSIPAAPDAKANGSATTQTGAAAAAPLVISPLVRRMVKEAGLKLTDISGSGTGGLIMRRDVEAAVAGQAPADSVPAGNAPAGSGSVGEPLPAGGAAFGEDAKSGLGITARTPIKGLRKTVAANMTKSRTEIPEATVWVDVDATALLEMRSRLKASNPDNTPGLLAFIARFVLAGLAKYPELNTRIEGDEIVGFDGVNLGFAAQTDRGLMVPSIRKADKMSARQLDSEIRRLAAVAREGKASPAELTSGTFTLNNYGIFGVDGSAAIINYPEVAILGVGRIIDKPWVVNGELAVRKVTELTLTFDHRVCDGGTAGGFLRYVADAVENPGSVLADL
ncbi:dihydrolipoamide acetyltransferase family protein [Arthrobacter monumenti]